MLSYPDKYTVSTVDATEFAARTAMDMAANDISKVQRMKQKPKNSQRNLILSMYMLLI